MALMGVVLTAIVASCAQQGIPDDAIQQATDACGFPADTELAFAAESTATELGLWREVTRGMFYVTAERIVMDAGAPWPADRPARYYCVVYPLGNSQSGPVPDDWVPPIFP